MTAIARIGQGDPLRRRVDIWLGHESEVGLFLCRADGREERISDEGVYIDPSISIPEDVARALTESLVRHFNGAEDTRALRKDYDAERSRVDKLTEALTEIARRGPVVVEVPA